MILDYLPGLESLWGFLRTGIAFLFVLTVVVFFHELGHFLVARWCGVRVVVFSVGFGRELLGFTDRKGTRWKLAIIPLGGYVKFFGDENAASVPDREAAAGMTEAERKQSFIHKKVGARAAIVVAGPLANFILAIVIFAALLMVSGKQFVKPRIDLVKQDSPAATAGFQKGDIIRAIDGRQINSFSDADRIIALNAKNPLDFELERDGQRLNVKAAPELRKEFDIFCAPTEHGRLDIVGPVMRTRVGSVQPGSAASAAGLEVSDVITAINGKSVQFFSEVRDIVVENAGKPLQLDVQRGDRTLTLTATPRSTVEKSCDGTTRTIGLLGISGSFDPDDVWVVRYGPFAALSMGAGETWFLIEQTFATLGAVFARRVPADQIGGPIMIAQVSGRAASRSFATLISLAAFLSVSIGLLNLFPIPLLDGGHLMFYAVEAIRGRPLSERVQEYGFRVGFALVVMLMVFAFYNDIGRLFRG